MSKPDTAPITWIVSRHAGALQWLSAHGIQGRAVAHLQPALVHPGDCVVGTLPLQMVADLCERGARYLHLSLDLPPELRGCELSASQMVQCGARLEAFDVIRTERLGRQEDHQGAFNISGAMANPALEATVTTRRQRIVVSSADDGERRPCP